MKAEKYLFTKWQFIFILLAGTVIRFLYGYWSKAWLAAPDQLAWILDLDEMLNNKTWHYVQLVHAPHEGGSLLVSLLSLLFRPFQSIIPALSWAALLIDTLSRWVQLKSAQKLFGNRTALIFGIWTILSVPLLIPWGTVNYGLHSLFSFVPFVFLYVITKYRQNKYLPVICGLFCGIAVSVSYDSLVLVMVSVFFILFVSETFTNRLAKLFAFAAAFMLAVLPHMLARIYFDAAFSLNGDGLLSIRGVALDNTFSPTHFNHLATVWFTSLPGSFLLTFPTFLPAEIICILVCLFVFTGTILYVRNKPVEKHLKTVSLSIVVLFVIVYALGSFYGKSYHQTGYVYYRHWCYIVPLLVLIMIKGFIHAGKFKWYIVGAWMVLCGIASLQYFRSFQKTDQPSYRQAGWILANKYSNDPGKLFQIHAMAEQAYQEELLVGFGWGLSARIFRKSSSEVSLNKLVDIIRSSPVNCHPAMIRGIYYSFTKGITPVLDQGLLIELTARFSENGKQNK
ncbi:MAG: hypothetical protein V4557_09320 [Bacteroidota bacterium]